MISEAACQERWALLSSSALEFELGRTKDPQRRARTQEFLLAARERAVVGPGEIARRLCATPMA